MVYRLFRVAESLRQISSLLPPFYAVRNMDGAYNTLSSLHILLTPLPLLPVSV